MIGIYTEIEQGQRWLERYRGKKPIFACILGFTDTGLIPGISAAGATPHDRQFTCLADAEFLYNGPQTQPQYPLPPLEAGASPVLISRAVIQALDIPLELFNAGLPLLLPVPAIDLGGVPAKCLTSGNALEIGKVKHLLEQGLIWGAKLAAKTHDSYLILGECVVGGTTTALGVLMGLGIAAAGKVNSSHPQCNHAQKLAAVTMGLNIAGWEIAGKKMSPLEVVAAVGDPMQIATAGMAIAASRTCGVILAGGTQMLAVYALIKALSREYALIWNPERVVVGTTGWVAEDATGDTIGLANDIGGVPLLAAQLSFAGSRYPQLQAYDRGYVKEGVGAGACAIASHLIGNWSPNQLLEAVEKLASECEIK
ncbi:nicotinate mononucleotide-dependent phosphoribosyltransferase CobT [Tychonema sp. BBK16]|uniref:nicotinate mononucleotide-dependent phosphoribosyltransferase CobT n=1 Tax=Tychonema sp. BBK16 TaxID=2699888 RepID=UPI001F204DE9|nr:TIGR00303 family protein [Tychonema sp. BBK16]MCF6373894.1 TIGR00303 family protein [Tychonema sp. BBK16]